MKILSHRANGYGFPENTLPAFEAASRSSKNDGVEFDVQLTKDDVVVVHHDDVLGRVFEGDEPLQDLTFEELQTRKPLDPEHSELQIPRLSELLELFEDTEKILNIEFKISELSDRAKLIDKVLEEVASHSLSGQVLYSSFDREILEMLRESQPQIEVNLLLEENLNLLKAAKDHDGLHLDLAIWQKITAKQKADLLKETSIRIWTVNQKEDFERLKAEVIDAVITDRAEELQ